MVTHLGKDVFVWLSHDPHPKRARRSVPKYLNLVILGQTVRMFQMWQKSRPNPQNYLLLLSNRLEIQCEIVCICVTNYPIYS